MASGRSLLCSSVTCLSSQQGLTGAINEQTQPPVFVSVADAGQGLGGVEETKPSRKMEP